MCFLISYTPLAFIQSSAKNFKSFVPLCTQSSAIHIRSIKAFVLRRWSQSLGLENANSGSNRSQKLKRKSTAFWRLPSRVMKYRSDHDRFSLPTQLSTLKRQSVSTDNLVCISLQGSPAEDPEVHTRLLLLSRALLMQRKFHLVQSTVWVLGRERASPRSLRSSKGLNSLSSSPK